MASLVTATKTTMGLMTESRLPLYMRTSWEMPSQTSDTDLLLQVERLRWYEKTRWASRQNNSSCTNDVPFPMPSELLKIAEPQQCWKKQNGNSERILTWHVPEVLQPLSDKHGTWDPSAVDADEALRLRMATPLNFGHAPDRARIGIDRLACSECFDAEAIALFELEQWDKIRGVKMHERSMWGRFDLAAFPQRCFDSAQFPELKAISGELDPSMLRFDMHQDQSTWVTSMEGAVSAWEMSPESVVNAVPADDFDVQASGGFCLRVTKEFEQMQAAVPDEEWLCVICLEESSEDAVFTSCNHIFHQRCISKWLGRSTRCPLCRCKCRSHGPSIVLPPMVFDLDPWPIMPTGVVEEDVSTDAQERVAAQRAEAPLSMLRIEARRKELADRFRCEVPPAVFFQCCTSRPETDWNSTIGLPVVQARVARDQEKVARVYDQLALEGIELVSWPIAGRWPALVMNKRNERALASLTKRLEGKTKFCVLNQRMTAGPSNCCNTSVDCAEVSSGHTSLAGKMLMLEYDPRKGLKESCGNGQGHSCQNHCGVDVINNTV